MTEAKATKFGLEIAKKAGCLPLIIETDSQEVIDLVLNGRGTQIEIYWIVSEIQTILSRLKQSKIQHTRPRCGNRAAHSLAKHSLKARQCNLMAGKHSKNLFVCIH